MPDTLIKAIHMTGVKPLLRPKGLPGRRSMLVQPKQHRATWPPELLPPPTPTSVSSCAAPAEGGNGA